jgi:hypothetical protein
MDPWLEQFAERRKQREESDRTFIILGQKLTVKPSVAPEPALRIADFEARLSAYLEDAKQRKTGDPVPELGVSDTEMLDMAETAIRAALEPQSLKAWEKLRAPDSAEPLDLLEIYGLAKYVLSRAARVPTDGPSGSSDGPQNTARSSKAKSSSTAATRKH